ncbi:MAG: hypothetical protein A2Y10_09845 [Planctomycetes bacterium GWF2_41_51]|nr:MAG: hypothetical protein A2Y10_09845 [Planctomycetes bacterium GWF2_41_51]HBG25464.1 hypothetical protein [Phycisphaerales bacterium]
MYKDFFELLDLERPKLHKVREAVIAGNHTLAAIEFIEYMRNRSVPVFYEGWDNRKINRSYDTAEADKVCKRHIVHVDVGDDIDWKMDPHHDPEWKYCLNRHEFLTVLGRAYWYTGNEKYTAAFKELLVDWITKNPLPDVDWMLKIPSAQSRGYFMKEGNWRPISAGIRLYTAWCPCYYHFLNSPEFTPEFNIKMLLSMVDHARYLRRYYTRHVDYFHVSPNWGLMESNGLAHMGILFPEFKEAEDWRNTALSRFEEQTRMQILPDGVHVERCSGYHLVCTFCILQITELALRNGFRVSQTWLNGLEKMIDYVLYLMKPHGVYPMLSDGDESDVIGERASYGLWEDINNLNMLEDSNDLRYVLKAGARLFNRPDMLYAATLGKQGQKPAKQSAAFPYGGFYVSRSGWKNDDYYMSINCGPLGVYDQECVHGHADALSIDVSAFGKTLIIDPGRYMYEGPFRIWFKGTAAHNTVVVDGKDQSQLADGWKFKTMAVPTKRVWCTTDNFDYFDGSHNGYERLNEPVTHRRRVLAVKGQYWVLVDDLVGEGKHKLELYYHFPENAKINIDDRTAKAIARYNDDVCLSILSCDNHKSDMNVYEGSENPIRGWVSYDYAVKMPAPELCRSLETEMPARFTTILVPFKGNQPGIVCEWIEENTLQIKRDGKIEVLILSGGSGKRMHYGDFEFDGECIFAQMSADGHLTRCFSAGSSYISYKKEVILDSHGGMKIENCEKKL